MFTIMKFFKKVLYGYHISFLWRAENFKSEEHFNNYTYELSFFWFSILSLSPIFLPISIFLSIITSLNGGALVIISLVFYAVCSNVFSRRLKAKFSKNWFALTIAEPVKRMPSKMRKKLLSRVNVFFLAAIGVLLLEMVIFVAFFPKLR